MKADLVERLRDEAECDVLETARDGTFEYRDGLRWAAIMHEAADRIAALEAEASEGERLREACRAAQASLAMLTEPNDIRSTSVTHAWAQAVAAERLCRVALIPEAPAREGWHLISSAPKDGTSVIIAVPANEPSGFVVGKAYCNERRGGWWWANLSYDDDYADPIRQAPTHWMPLPPPPSQEREG